MEKKVLNGEQIRKKQEKQFSIVYIAGLILFIIVMILLNNNFGKEDELNFNKDLLKTPNIINVDENKNKGKTLEELLKEYNVFINEIEQFNLEELKIENFTYYGEEIKYADKNYTYYIDDNFIKLTRQEETVYYAIIEEGIIKIELYKDKTYLLEYSSSLISFKVDSLTYNINIKDNKYYLESNYTLDNVFKVDEEIYDKEWAFVNLNLESQKNSEVKYTGYFMEDIEGYYLSEDKSTIKKVDSEEEKLSTVWLDNNEDYYYTISTYSFSNNVIKDVLIVNNSQEFPFK